MAMSSENAWHVLRAMETSAATFLLKAVGSRDGGPVSRGHISSPVNTALNPDMGVPGGPPVCPAFLLPASPYLRPLLPRRRPAVALRLAFAVTSLSCPMALVVLSPVRGGQASLGQEQSFLSHSSLLAGGSAPPSDASAYDKPSLISRISQVTLSPHWLR